jgi:ubiquinone/menaquinone biosynthesis C-methylase UbiE
MKNADHLAIAFKVSINMFMPVLLHMNSVDVKRKKNERKYWNRISRIYDSWIEKAFEDQYAEFRLKFGSSVQPTDTVLELGTGTGDIALHIAPHCKEVVGIDLAPEMITIANGKRSVWNLENISFQVEDAYNLPFDEFSFDKVICCNVLQTMKDPLRAITEGRKVLKDGGDFISITYCFGDSSFWELLKLIKWVILYGKPRYWINFTRNDLIANFKRADFEILEDEDIWKTPVVLFLRCKKRG